MNKVRRQLRAAPAQRCQAGRVCLFEVWMVDQFAGHDGDTAHRRDLLGLNQFQRLARVPAIHQHDLAARSGNEIRGAIVRRDMEERRRDQANRNRRFFGWHFPRGARGRELGGSPRKCHVQQVGHTAPMGQLCAFRETGRAGCIEDARIRVGVDTDIRQCAAMGQHV